jgi:hypothetical protein
MEDYLIHWIEFGAIVVTTGAVVICCYFSVLEYRWVYKKRRMEANLDSLRRDPQMHICTDEEQIVLDTKIGQFRRVIFS